MRQYRDLGSFPSALSLPADEIMEFHLARILLLLSVCGRKDRISGLTKFAKLDFFVRYPDFFTRAANQMDGKQEEEPSIPQSRPQVESTMVRHHYGPWDKRYYHLIARLSALGLISVNKSRNTFNFELTEKGKTYAKRLLEDDAFIGLVEHMKAVSEKFGGKNGTYLKNLIYQAFEEEVAERALGKSIR